MANRFLDTNYYKSPFVRGLKGALKSLYSFIICDCDGAGIWNLDLPAASLYIGFEINMLEFNEHFVEKSKAIPIGGDKYFFPDFIEHQYPSGLQENNTAHKNFIKTLKKFNLIDNDLNVKKKGALKGLTSLIGLGNGLCHGNGNEEVVLQNLNNREPRIPTKDAVWEVFHRNGGTKEMAKSFYEKYEGTGWVLSGSPIINFTPLANKFIDNWKRNENKKTNVVDSTNVKIKLK